MRARERELWDGAGGYERGRDRTSYTTPALPPPPPPPPLPLTPTFSLLLLLLLLARVTLQCVFRGRVWQWEARGERCPPGKGMGVIPLTSCVFGSLLFALIDILKG